jgi:hypothetical protein
MFGGVGKSAGWATILGAVGVVLGGSVSAQAADLGGDCCADLEERVAELEATAARKGDRKVSLTVSGWVNEAIFAWDDGTEHHVYQGTNMLEQTRFRFTGEAKIDKNWSAGFVFEIGGQGEPSNQWNQFQSQSTNLLAINQDGGLIIRKDNWFIKSKELGQVAVGLNGTATYHLLDDADGANTRLYADAEGPAVAMSAFLLRHNGAQVGSSAPGLKWTDALRGFNNSTPGQDGRRSVVRYDSPTFHGFAVIASWGQSDIWDAALTYKDKIGDFTILARAGYGASNDPGVTSVVGQTNTSQTGTACGGTQPGKDSQGPPPTPLVNDYDCTWEGGAATIKHNPTGLYVYGGWGRQHFTNFTTTKGVKDDNGIVLDPTSTTWFIQPGIEEKWLPLGKTTIFGQYQHDDDGSNPGSTVGATINFWQAGVIQNIEAAAMDLYVIYQRADGDVRGDATTLGNGKAPNGTTSLDAFSLVTVGGLIQF